jgi:hypothetical protein
MCPALLHSSVLCQTISLIDPMAYLQFLHQVLHLMKYLVINGHSEFRAQLRHNAEAVKKAVSKYQLGSGIIYGEGGR